MLFLRANTHDSMLSRALLVEVVAAGLALVGVAKAERPVRVHRIDGVVVEGAWGGAEDAANLRIDTAEGTRTVPIEAVMAVTWPKHGPQPRPEPVIVTLNDGSRLFGSVQTGDAEGIRLAWRPYAVFSVPMASLAALRRHGEPDESADQAFGSAVQDRHPSQDTLIIRGRDTIQRLRGVTISLDPREGAFRWRQREVPLDSPKVLGLVFAAPPTEAPPPGVTCRLIDGSILCGRLVGSDITTMTLAHPLAGEVTLPLTAIRELTFRNANVRFLSDTDPIEYVFEPFGVTRWPWRRNRSVADRPLRIGGQTYERGIGMHARSTLTFAVDEGYTRLAAVIGIDDACGPDGVAIFRVMADDAILFDSGLVAGSDEARSILVPLNGARRISLMVDFGDGIDLGDQADWADVRVIR